MGHTVYPMRWMVYEKIQQFKKLTKALREPEKTAAVSLLHHLYQHISAISYANPVPDDLDDHLIFSMLIEEKKKRKIAVDAEMLFLFSLMIQFKTHKLKVPDARHPHRLLSEKR